MNKVEQLKKMWSQGGCKLEVYDAPSDAQTFDKMLVVFVDQRSDLEALAGLKQTKPSGKRIIRRVTLYNSKEDKIVGEY